MQTRRRLSFQVILARCSTFRFHIASIVGKRESLLLPPERTIRKTSQDRDAPDVIATSHEADRAKPPRSIVTDAQLLGTQDPT